MKIVEVKATAVKAPVKFDFLGESVSPSLGACIVEVTTDSGIVGVGLTAITEEVAVEAVINKVVAPLLIGKDPLDIESIWHELYWALTPRGQSGYATHAIAAIDIALWDIKGIYLKMPLWKLFGGFREYVPCYATVGFDFFDDDQMIDAFEYWKSKGFKKFKMVVAPDFKKNSSKSKFDATKLLDADVRRVKLARETIGDSCELFIDANCNLDYHHALYLGERVKEFNIGFFEEPIMNNNPYILNKLRSSVGIPLSGGQNYGQSLQFSKHILAGSLDIIQPNAVITGGYSQCLKIFGLADCVDIPVHNGGSWLFHNMHLHGGLNNGGMVEYHLWCVRFMQMFFTGLPDQEDGYIKMPSAAGNGFSLNYDSLREYKVLPD